MVDKSGPGATRVKLPEGKIITLDGGGGRSLGETGQAVQHHYAAPLVAAVAENELYELTTAPDGSPVIQFLDLTEAEGQRIYQRSLTLLFIKAVYELFPGAEISVEHSLGPALYCEIKKVPALSSADVAAIEQKMRQLVELDLPIKKRQVTPAEAAQIFNRQGFTDKVELIKYWSKDYINLYTIGDMEDTLYGYQVPRTGLLGIFGLQYYPPGLVIKFPDEEDPMGVAPFREQKKLFEIFQEAESWGHILGFDTVGAMNTLIERGRGPEMMRIAEALHE